MFTFRKNGHFYEKTGKKGESVCIDDEISFDIPDNWEVCRLENIAQFNGGYAFKSNNFKDNGIRVIRISDFDENGFKNDKLVYYDEKEEFDKFVLGDNDILMAMTGGTVGKTLFVKEVSEKMYINQRVADIKISNKMNIEFIYKILNSHFIKRIIHRNKNSTNDNISMKVIKSFIIPIPPFKEQKRILNKINELFLHVDNYKILKNELDKLNSKFPEKLKSSILQEAIQGKLVPQDPNDEPASVLLEKIREEKERLIKEKKIKRNKKESYIFKENNHFYEKIGKELIDINNELPFEIPDNWMWCKLENITSNIHYGYTASAQEVGDVKLLRITDIHENNVNWDSVPYCVISDDKLTNYILKNRDIVMARTGGTIGKSYIIDNLNKKAVFASYLIRIIPLKNINENYLKQFFESPLFWSQLRDNTKGTGQPNVNAKSLKSLLIPLPPFIEQEKIVIKIEKIFNEINLRLKI